MLQNQAFFCSGLPVISNQKMNDYIKELGKLAGIDTKIRITQYKGHDCIDTIYPKLAGDSDSSLIAVEKLINIIRGQQVMIDSDLAKLYEVETCTLNQALKRKIERFPVDFMFQLTKNEAENLMSQFVSSSLRSQNVTLNEGSRNLK